MISFGNQMTVNINQIINKINDIINNISGIITMLITHLETSSVVDLQHDLSW